MPPDAYSLQCPRAMPKPYPSHAKGAFPRSPLTGLSLVWPAILTDCRADSGAGRQSLGAVHRMFSPPSQPQQSKGGNGDVLPFCSSLWGSHPADGIDSSPRAPGATRGVRRSPIPSVGLSPNEIALRQMPYRPHVTASHTVVTERTASSRPSRIARRQRQPPRRRRLTTPRPASGRSNRSIPKTGSHHSKSIKNPDPR